MNFDIAPQDCDRCPSLVKQRSQVVNGRALGSNPRMLVCGQNPGKNEDEQGKCFVGDAGTVQAELFRQAGIPLADVHLTNAARCWSPGNRVPKKEERDACRPYLMEEIEQVKPKVIVALGACAIHSLYKVTSVGSVAGQTLVQPDTGIPLVCTYHPAYLLRGKWNAVPLVLAHLKKAKAIADGTQQTEEMGEYHVIDSIAKLGMLKDYLATCDKFAVDCETTGLDWKTDDILCVQFSGEVGEGYTVPVLQQHRAMYWSPGDWREMYKLIAEILRLPNPKIMQGGSFDLRMFEREPSEFVSAPTSFGWEVTNFSLDTLQMHKQVAENLPKEEKPNELPSLLALHTGMPPYEEKLREESSNKTKMEKVSNETLWRYGGADVDALMRLEPILSDMLDADGGSRWVYNNITVPMLRCCQAMTMRGVAVDRDYFRQLCDHYAGLVDASHARIEQLAGHEVNANSNQQVQQLLFEELGATKSGKKTDAASECEKCQQHACNIHDKTDEESLLQIKAEAQDEKVKEAIDAILDERGLVKKQSTYLEGRNPEESIGGFLAHFTGDNRLHCSFNVGGAATGRLSSFDPNGQNVPNKVVIPGLHTKNAFRRTFVAPPGHTLMEADWSQLEVWTLAYRLFETYGDRALLDLLLEGRDIHTWVGRQLWPDIGADLDEFEWRREHDDVRTRAKVFTFGIQYGLTVAGIMNRLNCGEQEAAGYLTMYFEAVPTLRDHFHDTHATILNGDILENRFGRRRRFPEVPVMRAAGGWKVKTAVEEILRVGINFDSQAGGSDLHNLAGHIPSEFSNELRKVARIVLAVHDSCLFEVPFAIDQEDQLLDVAWKIKQLWQDNARNMIMPDGKPLDWRVPVEVSFGESWGNMNHRLTAKGEVFHDTDESA